MEKLEKVLVSAFFVIVILEILYVKLLKLSGTYTVIFVVLDIFLLIGIYLISRHKKKVIEKRKEIALLFFVIVIFFLVLELALAFVSCSSPLPEKFVSGSIQYKHGAGDKLCNTIKDGFSFRARANSDGFVDTDFSNESDFNIFLLGDSFAECLQAEYGNCVHNNLEKSLSEEYGENISVLNFGTSGYGVLDELGTLQEYKDVYRPDMIVLYFLAQNDLNDNIRYLNYKPDENYAVKKVVRDLSPKSFRFVAKRARLLVSKIWSGFSEDYRLQYNYHNNNLENYDVYLKEYDEEWNEKLNVQFSGISGINEIAKSLDIPLVLVLITSTEQVYEEDWERLVRTFPELADKEYDLARPNELVGDFAEENDILYLDLLPHFKADERRLHWERDGHWNDEGQLFAGELIRNFIVEKDLIKESL